MRILRRTVIAALVFYLGLLVGIVAIMRQPPTLFGKVMAKVPEPLFAVVPFKQLWLFARAGRLRVGDVAPDFALRTPDKKENIRLSSLRGRKPVVLVFGSYT